MFSLILSFVACESLYSTLDTVKRIVHKDNLTITIYLTYVELELI